MSKNTTVKHKIQIHIIDYLAVHQSARFRDLRPPRVDTNLCTYHVKQLVQAGMVRKEASEYRLGPQGIRYVDQVGRGTSYTPKTITMFVVQNGDGDILLQRRTTHPYIDTWSLPHDTPKPDDTSMLGAAQRHVRDVFGLDHVPLEHAGDCYIRVTERDEPVTTTFVHVFRLYSDDARVDNETIWARPHKLAQLQLAPAVEDIMTRTFFKDPFFFEEFHADWYNK